MEQRSDPDRLLFRLVSIFLALAFGIGLTGYLFFSQQKQRITGKAENVLSAVADLKVKQVVSLRRELVDDGDLLNGSIPISSITALRQDNHPLLQNVRAWLHTVRTSQHHLAILLMTPAGKVVLSEPEDQGAVGPDGVRLAREAAASGRIILSDLYQSRIAPVTRFSLLVPVFKRPRLKEDRPLGVLLVRIDPADILYPLISTWPGTSTSAETFAIRREQAEAVLLNDTRSRSNVAHTLRIPLEKTPPLAQLLDSGEKGVIRMNDQHDVPVIAAVQPVPGTSWYLVAKMDQEEVLSSVRREAFLLIVIVLLLIGGAGLGIYLLWRRQIAEQQRQHAASEQALKSVSTRYDYLSKYANDIILITDYSGKIIEANDRAAAVYGYRRDELLQLTFRDLFPSELRSNLLTRMDETSARSGVMFESLNRHRDGSIFPVEVSSRIVETGDVKLYQNILRDITDRRHAENKIRHVTWLYAFLSQANQAIMRAGTRNDLFSNICRTAVEFGGFTAAWIGQFDTATGIATLIPAVSSGLDEKMLDVLRIESGHITDQGTSASTTLKEGSHVICNNTESTAGYELSARLASKAWAGFPFKQADAVAGALFVYSAEPAFFGNAEIKLLDAIVLDISWALDNLERETQRRAANDELKSRTVFIETILDNLPIGLAVNRVSDGTVLYVNNAFEQVYGWPREQLSSVKSFFECVYPNPAVRAKIIERVLADIASGDVERMRWDNISIMTQNGEQRYVTAINIPLFGQDLMISTVQDVTRRTEAEQELRESRHRFKRLVESVTDYIYTVHIENGSTVATAHGPSCVSVTGYTSEEYEADPGLWLRMVHEEDRALVVDRANAIVAGTPVAPFEHRIIHKDGSLRWVRNTPVLRRSGAGSMHGYDGLITDVTALKTLENQLRQAQKMEAVGQLAGGVAHDFNNILTAIIGYANLLLMKLPEAHSERAYVEQILSSAERAGHLTNSLLTFSRKQIIDPKPVNVNEIIKRVKSLLGRVIGEDVELRTRLFSGELVIFADSIQIEQVLMNLATNARDAMANGGLLQIETDVVELGEDFVRVHSYAKPGKYGLIIVSDTGTGMDGEVKRRIFEPFFTTKAMGKGTGLGLAMVYGIVKQQNGYIHVYSEPRHGSTFKVYLPLCTSPVDTKGLPPSGSPARGSETILLVEDDDSVRTMTKKVLEDFGYHVIEAADGETALQIFAEYRDQVDMLILDIIMPKKNGKETYDGMKAMKPGIKVLFTSGYTADIVEQKGIIDTGLDFIGKPSAPSLLLHKVRTVLDKK